MGLFRLALQVCTIACVSIAIDGHVLLAVNVEDFRNLANRFLSKDLADKLTNLVSEISLGRMKENKQRVENELPDVDIIKEKHIKESARTNQYPTITIQAVTHNYKHKRFNTVKNSDSKELLRQAIYNTPPGPVYIRDEIDDLLLNINEGNSDNDNDRKKGYHPERLDDREYNIVSKEATRPFNLINISRDTHKEIDYTETKLGEWKYNHDITKEPPEIKNIKTGNADKDINDEGSTDYDKAKMHDLADNSDNEKNVQYVDETRLLGRFKNKYNDDVKVKDHQIDKEQFDQHNTKPKDNFLRKPHKESIDNIRMPKKQLYVAQTKISTTKDDSHVFEEHILAKKNIFNHENTPLKLDEATISQNIKEVKQEPKKSKNFLNDFLKDSTEAKQHESKEKETQQIAPPMQPIENNDMYQKYALGSQIRINNKKGTHPSVEDSKEKHNQEKKKKENADDYKNVGDQSGNNEQLYSKKVPPKRIATHRLPHHDEDKSEIDKSKPGHNRETKQIQNEHDNNNKGDQSGNKEKLLLRNKKNYTSFKVPESSEEASKKLLPKRILTHRPPHSDEDKFETNISKPEVSTTKSKKVKEQVHERYVTSTEETKEKSKEGKEYIGKKKPHKISKEENDTYEKFELGSENKKSNKRKPKLQAESDEFKNPIKENKMYKDEEQHIQHNNNNSYKAPIIAPLLLRNKQRFEDSEYCKNNPNSKMCREEDVTTKIAIKESAKVSRPHSVKEKKKSFSDHVISFKIKEHQVYRPDNYDLINGAKQKNTHKTKTQKKIEATDMYDKYELGRETKNDEDRNVRKQKENRGDIKTMDDKNKFNYQGHDKDLSAINEEMPMKSKRKPQKIIEENDMYDKYELGRDTDNDDKRNRKQKENRDDKKTMDNKNKFNYQGHNIDKSANSEEMPIKKVRKPQKKKGGSDMYDKYDIGRESKNDDNKNRKQKENRDGIKTMDDKNKFNYQDRNKDMFANSEEMPLKSKRKPQKKIEENDMYDKYEIGHPSNNDDKRNRKQKENRDDIRTMDDNNKFNNHGRIKGESANNEEMTIKSKKRYKNDEDTTTNKHKETKKGQVHIEKVPIAGYADDPQPDFKEVEPESIKAKTESLLDSEEPKANGRPTKKFTMKGTIVPKRDFYKLSSPDYYKDLPRVVEKYDFAEPIPEQDRVRDKVGYLKREPSRVNKKVKLSKYEKT